MSEHKLLLNLFIKLMHLYYKKSKIACYPVSFRPLGNKFSPTLKAGRNCMLSCKIAERNTYRYSVS